MHDPELDRFKTEISLLHYAAARYGYTLDRRESSRASHVLRHPANDDKIIVRRDADGHWTYFSVRDDRDHGTIVDFVQHRTHPNSLRRVREELRRWLGMSGPDPEPFLPAPGPLPDRRAVAFAAAQGADNSPYLNARGLRPETLRDPRFAGTWGLDARGNTLFVHTTDTGKVTGFEIKNRGFTGFSTGGTKSAWQSAALATDGALVVTESAIDALSHFQLHPEQAARARFLSTAGAPSPRQLEVLDRIVLHLPPASHVVAAVDADEAGEHLALRIEALVRGHAHLTFQRHAPSPAKDWNDVLQQVERDFIRSLPLRSRPAPDRGR